MISAWSFNVDYCAFNDLLHVHRLVARSLSLFKIGLRSKRERDKLKEKYYAK